MRQYTRPELVLLAEAICQAFPLPNGEVELNGLCQSANMDYAAYHHRTADYKGGVFDMLLTENEKGGSLDPLLHKLIGTNRIALVSFVNQLLVAPRTQPQQRWESLSQAYLVVDGVPLFNHDDLRVKILPRLLIYGDYDPLRALFITGPRWCGKTFAQKLIRRHCRASGFRFLPLDAVDFATNRDCVSIAQAVAGAMQLRALEVPRDDSEARTARRLVTQIVIAHEHAGDRPPMLLLFDHLNKLAGNESSPEVVGFILELATAVADGRLDRMRVVLAGLPASDSKIPAMHTETVRLIQPNEDQVADYLDRVMAKLDLDVDDNVFNQMVREVFSGQQSPYTASFMEELPALVREKVARMIEN